MAKNAEVGSNGDSNETIDRLLPLKKSYNGVGYLSLDVKKTFNY